MAATIILNVDVNDSTALAKLKAIDVAASKLQSSKIVINVDAGSTQATAASLTNLTNAQAKAIASSNRLAAEQEKTAQTANRMAAEQAKSADTATNVTNALTKLITAENRASVEQEKTAQTANRLAIEQEKTAQTANRLAIEQERTGRATLKAGDSATTASGAFSALAVALGNIASRAFHLVIRKITQGIREAVTEMKNVDTQLVNISKVSGKTGEALAAIGDTAYETASKYGVAASEYLSAVYTMQKAGMGEQSEAMGELAVKTMLVGDTTEEVASKFLISANAAWKMGGNMERLGQVVDEADYINNNYATSLDKLALSLPIVASVAAQAGMSTEETLAALGTIQAVTQESGTKSATALRALILNIEKEVGEYVTEEGEAFEVTEESVKSLEGMLWKYAGAEMEAAKQAGTLIDPLTAIRALAEAAANSDVNKAEIFQVLSEIGGKLRTNQLTALVENVDLLDEILNKIGDSAGTADNEISLMMEGWEKKAQVVQNRWTELIANVLDTNVIKDFLDGTAEMLEATTGIVQQLKDPFYGSNNLQDTIVSLSSEYANLLANADNLTGAEQKRLEYLQQQLDLLRQQEEETRKQEAEKLQGKLTASYFDPNFNKTITQDEVSLTRLRGQYSDAEHFISERDVKGYQEALKEIVHDNQSIYDSIIKVRDAGVELTDNQKEFVKNFEDIDAASKATVTDFQDIGDGITAAVDDSGDLVGIAREAQEELPSTSEILLGSWDAVGDAIDSKAQTVAETLTPNIEATAASTEDVSAAAAAINFSPAVKQAQALAAIMGGMGTVGFGFASGTTNAPGGPTLVNELGPELISENGRAYIANGGRPGIVNLSRGAIVLPANVTKEALRGGGKGRAIHAAAGGVAGSWLASGDVGTAGTTTTTTTTTTTVTETTYGGRPSSRKKKVGTGSATVNKTEKVTGLTGTFRDGTKKVATPNNGGGGGGGGGGGSGSKGLSALEKALKLAEKTEDILTNLDKQAKLADNQGDYEKEESIYDKAIKRIDKQIAAYRKAGYKDTSNEILDLLNKRYDYEDKKEAASQKEIKNLASELSDTLSNLDKQADLAESREDYLSQVQFYEKAQEAIKEMVDNYRKAGYADDSDEILELLQKNYDYADKQVQVYTKQWNNLIDALEADTDAQELANQLAEKQQALEEARLALENAQKNRTIRHYNAATGQWEWVSDQEKISSAQQTLTKAEEAYADELKSQAIKELETMRDTMADLNDVILGPALSTVIGMAENSTEFQNFARALNAVYGVGSFLSSTEGSSNVISTANDSHDTYYTFGNVTLTQEEADTMSVAQLAQKLQVLKIS